MIILINAGGSGTRLWPLSTSNLPKQFLSLVDEMSLLQAAYARALKLVPKENIYISTSKTCQKIVLDQIPSIALKNIITEPCRKDTMGSILNSAQYISTHHSKDEPIASISSDHFIKDGLKFNQDIQLAAQTSQQNNCIVLLGMEPDKPGPKFGHIKKGAKLNGTKLFEVAGFKEKPDLKTAKQYFDSKDYLFNAGSFIASYQVFKQEVSAIEPEWLTKLNQLEDVTNQQQRDQIYETFQKTSIDVGLIEKTSRLLVLPQSYPWVDLGSFDDVYAVSTKDDAQNSTSKSDALHILNSSHNYIKLSDTKKPVAIAGVKDLIIVDTPNGLLIAHMNHAQEIKKISEELEQ